MSNLLKRVGLAFAVFVCISAVFMSSAQDIATPTPPAERSSLLFEPRLQSDLNVLTGNVQRPNGLTYLDGMLYIACTGDNTIYETNAITGSTRTYIWGVMNAHTLVAERDNNDLLTLWIPDYQSNTLTRISRGNVQAVVRNLDSPWGITDVNSDYFLVTSLRSNTVERIERDGQRQVMIEGLAAPTGIDSDGTYVYVANNGSARRAIEYYSLDDLASGESSGQRLVSGVQNPTGVQLASDGNLYFAYSLGTRGVVGRVNPDRCRENGGCGNDQVEIVLYTELAAPLAGLTITPDMRLFVHTMFSPDIFWTQL
jgi:DNA-binding beta-propeller fold protein YncE